MRREDLQRLYKEHAAAMYAFLAYRTGDARLAEDLVADTFERALRARRRFDPRRASEKTWLYAIALNLLRDQARRARAEGRALDRFANEVQIGSDSVPGPEARIGGSDALRQAMTSLADEEREAIALRFGAELTVPEIAGVIGAPLTTAESRVYGALRKLRDILDEEMR